ncbi:MAG: hypothetical protein ACRETR_09100 [Steroidobacteraceae bacterium]
MLDPSPWALAAPADDSVELFVLSPRTEPAWEPWLAAQPPQRQRWLRACQFEAAAGQVVALPAADGSLAGAIIGLGETDPADLFAYGSAVARLPATLYAVGRRHWRWHAFSSRRRCRSGCDCCCRLPTTCRRAHPHCPAM